ncbi:MAG: ATP-dependent Clp protease proteolytic subunit [Ruminococcus sp.]|nr:ATP-dependent Clp protease proteolytic subunit [Ruminococcus sp.]
MNVEVRTSGGITLVPIESVLMTNRKIFVVGEINDDMACEFVKQILLLNLNDSDKPIDILVNSAGGEINSGMLMYDAIQSCKAPVRTFCIGKAYSMAAVLVASATGGRYILPHGEMMIHEPQLKSALGGDSSSIKSAFDSIIETRRNINHILSIHTGKSFEEVEEATGYDHFFSAKESVEFGLCDEVISFDKI